MITANEAKEISVNNKIYFTKEWLKDFVEPAIKIAAGLGLNKLIFKYEEPTDDEEWCLSSNPKKTEFYCPWDERIAWDYVRKELAEFGYEITNAVYSVEKTIAYITW